jgi:hypothetical protein
MLLMVASTLIIQNIPKVIPSRDKCSQFIGTEFLQRHLKAGNDNIGKRDSGLVLMQYRNKKRIPSPSIRFTRLRIKKPERATGG